MRLDHMILPVNDLDASVAFYVDHLGFTHEGQTGPFTVLRVNDDFTIQLSPWGTSGGVHLAFSLAPADFEARFTHIRDSGMPYGDSFDTVGNMKGPGREDGARGLGAAVYVFDPNEHLIEIRHYGD